MCNKDEHRITQILRTKKTAKENSEELRVLVPPHLEPNAKELFNKIVSKPPSVIHPEWESIDEELWIVLKRTRKQTPAGTEA